MRRAGAVCLLIAVLAACTARQPGLDQGDTAVIRTHEDGYVSLTVSIPRHQISVADRIALTVDVRAPEDAGVEFPVSLDELGEFTVVATTDADPQLVSGGRIEHSRTYLLEPPVPGEYEIPSPEVRLSDGRTLTTDPLQIRVASVIPDAEGTPALRDIAPPVDLPGLSPWLYFLMGAGVMALALVAWWLWRRRKRRAAAAAVPDPPHQVALRELRKLLDEHLIEKGLTKDFYLRLSNILRRYIEDRFGLHAPERTTEEFLADLRHEVAFGDLQKKLIGEFLTHCDMVKFAEHQPSRDEVDGAVNACAQFIAETRLEAPSASDPASSSARAS